MDRRRWGFLVIALGAACLLVAAWEIFAPAPPCVGGTYGNYCGMGAATRAVGWGIAGLILVGGGAILLRRSARQILK